MEQDTETPNDEGKTVVTVEVADRIDQIDPEAWDRMLGDDDGASPFLEWRFLQSLEEAGTLGAENGWIPRFPMVKVEDELVAAAPAYVKLHSQGEFVFDWSWASFSDRLGERYYPKLLVGVPFTPVTGRRLLTAPGHDRDFLMKVLGQVFVEMAEAMELSSVHVNFALEEEVLALAELGYLHRLGIQYHWYRHDEPTFDGYLGRFNSKKRNQLKRELRAPGQQGVQLEVIPGKDLSKKEVKTAFKIYKSTVDKFYWGRQYLNQKVFHLWAENLGDLWELVAARDEKGKIMAGAINFAKGRRLFGRYWGCFSEVKHLHFNVCYYRGIQEAYDRGLDVFEPGAGGEHKLVRGFEPTLMHSAHFLRNEMLYNAIARHLDSERLQIQREQQLMHEATGRKKT